MSVENKIIGGEDRKTFEITLNRDFKSPLDSSEFQWVVSCDPYKVEEPLNLWHKIKCKLGLKYKTKDIGWEYALLKSRKVEGKIVVEYKGRE